MNYYEIREFYKYGKCFKKEILKIERCLLFFWLLLPLLLLMRIEAKIKRCTKCWSKRCQATYFQCSNILKCLCTTMFETVWVRERVERRREKGGWTLPKLLCIKNMFANAFKWIWRQIRNIVPSIARRRSILMAVVVDLLPHFFTMAAIFSIRFLSLKLMYHGDVPTQHHVMAQSFAFQTPYYRCRYIFCSTLVVREY